jgi:hypothetical protein
MTIRFVCAQPATLYYAWQVEVMINNFSAMGINPNNIDIVCWRDGSIPIEWSKLANNYAARFFFYDDTRENKNYVSSIRPNILKQHFKKFPELEQDAIFYHDCDIVFTKPIEWYKFLYDDKWYGSDTRFYIGYEYIMSKGEQVLDAMCNIVGIDKEIIKENERNSIGAQYLMKGIGWKFWDNVERNCERLYKEITELSANIKADNPVYHELQIWCADMWAVLWEGWKMGKKTICHPDLEFAWATSRIESWDKLNIYHNAGAIDAISGLFFKSNYINKLPYGETININKEFASSKYWELIQQTKTVL